MPAINDLPKTIAVGTAWVWELFPFSSVYPVPNEFDGQLPPGGALSSGTQSLLSGGDILSTIGAPSPSLIKSSLAVTGSGENVTLGIRSFNFSRNKNSPDNTANLTLVGKPPKDAFPGVWCCLTSVDPTTGKKRVRFIGQIASATYGWTTLPNGLVATQSTFMIREWSSILRVPVRMESMTVSQAMYDNNVASAINFAGKVLGEDISKAVTTAAYNPFLLATLVLQMLGAISDNNSKNTIKELADKNYYEVASRMPVIPPALLTRLGIDIASGTNDPLNSFANGFVQFINGIRVGDTDPGFTKGNWDGVFSNGVKSISDFQDEYSTNNTGRPVADNVGFIVSMNIPGWDLLSVHCDPSYNEFFTDIYYEKQDDGTEAVQPVFVFRDKPFLLKDIKDQINNKNLNKFSLYDDLPRVKIEPAAIVGFNFTNTILNSANLLRIEWTDVLTNADAAKQAANAAGYNILLPEMLRFGGQERVTHTNFVSFGQTTDDTDAAGQSISAAGLSSADWWTAARDIATAWYAYDYRFCSGVLVTKDYNLAISVGHNVEFRYGNFTLVGHVEGLNFSIEVDAKGNIQNMLRISISKVVQKIDKKLAFISPDQFGSLADLMTEPAPGDSVVYPNLPNSDQLQGATSAASAFLGSGPSSIIG